MQVYTCNIYTVLNTFNIQGNIKILTMILSYKNMNVYFHFDFIYTFQILYKEHILHHICAHNKSN